MLTDFHDEMNLEDLPAHKCILNSHGQGMTDMQTTRDIGRRSRNDEKTFRLDLAVCRELWFEEALSLPPIVPGRFDCDRVVSTGHWLCHIYNAY